MLINLKSFGLNYFCGLCAQLRIRNLGNGWKVLQTQTLFQTKPFRCRNHRFVQIELSFVIVQVQMEANEIVKVLEQGRQRGLTLFRGVHV